MQTSRFISSRRSESMDTAHRLEIVGVVLEYRSSVASSSGTMSDETFWPFFGRASVRPLSTERIVEKDRSSRTAEPRTQQEQPADWRRRSSAWSAEAPRHGTAWRPSKRVSVSMVISRLHKSLAVRPVSVCEEGIRQAQDLLARDVTTTGSPRSSPAGRPPPPSCVPPERVSPLTSSPHPTRHIMFQMTYRPQRLAPTRTRLR